VATNITKVHQDAFNALTSGEYNSFALFSCFVDGKPASAIVNVTRAEDGQFIISPLFVSVTPEMVLTDHDGRPA
jgi:hypothetical protein